MADLDSAATPRVLGHGPVLVAFAEHRRGAEDQGYTEPHHSPRSRKDAMAVTYEEILTLFQETDRKLQATERLMREQSQETDRRFQETDRRFQETDRRFQETERLIRERSRETDR
ncbi:MAG: hypothetical protein VBE63_23105 [Lamprobacter sp.]|nr:hypothetical protein [Lamprobacter sp.]